MDDLLSEFLTETNESLQLLDTELVKLEQNPDSPELLDNIFRVMHTIKGTCGFLDLPRLESVAHAGENVLGKIREGELTVSPERVSVVLECLDRIRLILSALEETEAEPEGNDDDLIPRLETLIEVAEGKAPAEEAPASVAEQAAGPDAMPDAAEEPAEQDADAAGWDAAGWDEAGWDEAGWGEAGWGDAESAEGGAADSTAPASTAPAERDSAEAAPAASSPAQVDTGKADAGKADGASADSVPSAAGSGSGGSSGAAPAQAAGGGDTPRESQVANQSIRVSLELLENLMTTVSELVLNRNQLLQILRTQQESDFAAPLQRLNHVVSELQEGVMKTRMQPIGNAWSKLPRIVRDLSQELGKKIEMRMKGEETELDRQVLDLIKDPLTHMVRNSADHGLESPEERNAAGKPETGTISLNAYHEGGHIIIEIGDDGRGLDVDKIKAKAIRNGLTTEADVAGLSEQQVQQFVFKAGFSTADQVTAVSGRGVGMDVVRSNIEQIGGTIELSSRAGEGTKFTVKIPLTLAIVSALIVECAGERFAIPQLSVVELVRAKGGSENAIERIKDTPVLRLRDRLLPLVNLRELLQLQRPEPAEAKAAAASGEATASANGAASAGGQANANGANASGANANSNGGGKANGAAPVPAANGAGHGGYTNGAAHTHDLGQGGTGDGGSAAQGEDIEDTKGFIVVSQVGTYTFGIIVDQVFDTEEIVVKPVAKILRNIPLFSGNTILGDGRVVMILDPNGVASASGDITLAESEAAVTEKGKETARDEDEVAMLIFRAVDKAPKAVPLALVARLEEVDMTDVEFSNGQRVVQYRGQLTPLIQMDGAEPLPEEGKKPVLVFTDRDRSMGLVVDEIVDIVDAPMKIELAGERDGYLGSAVIAQKATDIIDAGYYLTQAFSDWFHAESRDGEKEGSGKRILLVDDSPFFRNLLAPLLDVAGYDVTPVESADQALKLCDSGESFDVIVSDIEMPGMSGYELAETLRNKSRWSRTPLVALSSHASPKDMERGRAAGFRDYVAKFDRETLLDTLHDMLNDDIGETRGAA